MKNSTSVIFTGSRKPRLLSHDWPEIFERPLFHVWVTYGERGLPKRCERREMPRSSHEKEKKKGVRAAIMDDKACYEYHVFRTKRNLHLRYTWAATHGNPMDKLRIMQMTRCPMNENHAVFAPLSRLRHGSRIFTKKKQNCQVLHVCLAFCIFWLFDG